jgi:aryl-alcohol dehydrogenase-like predicted oxidoreductase
MTCECQFSDSAQPVVVSRLGLGLAALGRLAYNTLGRKRDRGVDRSVANLERRCHEMLDAAYAAGIRYVDAAYRTAWPRTASARA